MSPELLIGLGASLSIFLASAGSVIASVPSGVFAARCNDDSCWKPYSAIIISGVLAIYGIIVSVVLTGKMNYTTDSLTEEDGFKALTAGLCKFMRFRVKIGEENRFDFLTVHSMSLLKQRSVWPVLPVALVWRDL
jgi:hypothetical protein